MRRIKELDRILNHIRHFSKDLSPIPNTDLSMDLNMDIGVLVEYLEELRKREYIDLHENGSYITLRGRMALEGTTNNNPFENEVDSKRRARLWTITKIIAAVLNACAIIGIAIWAQISSNRTTELENELKELKEKFESRPTSSLQKTDSLQTKGRDLNYDSKLTEKK